MKSKTTVKKPVKKVSKVEKVERTRYSDPELVEFKDIILKKLDEARRDLELLTEAYTNKNENDINDTSPTFKVLEEGYEVLQKKKMASWQHVRGNL